MRASWLLLVTPLFGCGGPKLGDLDTPAVSVVVTAISSDSDVAVAGEPRAGLGVERAFVSMSSLTLTPCLQDASEIILDPRGYELVSERPNEELIETAVTDLCGLRFEVDPLAQNATDGVPEGASLYLAGTSADGAPFEIETAQSWSLQFEVSSSQSFGQEPLLLGFDLSVWLAGVPLDPGDEDLTQQAFEENLRGAVGLYRDDDGNGQLEGDEQTAVATATAAR